MNLQILYGSTSVYDAEIAANTSLKLAVAGETLTDNISILTSSGDAVTVSVKYNNADIYSDILGNDKLILQTASKLCVYDIYVSLVLNWIDPIQVNETLTIQQVYSATQTDNKLDVQ